MSCQLTRGRSPSQRRCGTAVQGIQVLPGEGGAQVLRVDRAGKTNKMYIKRRDLLRRNRLLPRDLRRIDPTLSVIKTSPSITIKDHALLVNLGGVRCAAPSPMLQPQSWDAHGERPSDSFKIGTASDAQQLGVMRVATARSRDPLFSAASPADSLRRWGPCSGAG